MGRLRRLDTEMVRRRLAPSRTQAAKLIEAGRVCLDGEVILKPARQLDPSQAIVVKDSLDPDYASRAGYKLAGALDLLADKAPPITGRRCLDAGASTGGFTDVLLRRGATSVIAVDVGYGQLRWELQQDPRVEVHDRTNVRTLTPEQIGELPQLIVGDLSFISLTVVLPALIKCSLPETDFLLMVKPQFEIGKDRLGAGGVVRDPDDHLEVICRVISSALEGGLQLYAVAASPLPGPAGNVEYFIHLRHRPRTQISDGKEKPAESPCLAPADKEDSVASLKAVSSLSTDRALPDFSFKPAEFSKVSAETSLDFGVAKNSDKATIPAMDRQLRPVPTEEIRSVVWQAICVGPGGNRV